MTGPPSPIDRLRTQLGNLGRLKAFRSAGALFDAGWLLSLRLLRQVLAIGVVAVLVRSMPKDAFGDYQLVLTLVGAWALFNLPGVQRAIVQSVARGYPGTFRAATRLVLWASAVGSILLLALSAWFYWRGTSGVALALAAAAVLFIPGASLVQWQSLELGRRAFRSVSMKQAFGVIGSNAAIVLVALFGLTAPWQLIFAGYGVLAAQNLWQSRLADQSLEKDAPVEAGSLKYGLDTSVWDGLNLIANYADRLFLYAFISPVALAAYAVADRIPENLKQNVQNLALALIPKFAKRGAYTREMDWKLNLFGAVTCVGMLLVAFLIVPWLLPLLYTSQYESSVLYCQLITISVAITCFSIAKNAYIQSQLDAKGFRDIMLWGSVIRIVSSFFLVRAFGPVGAASSAIVYRLANVGLTEWRIHRGYRGKGDAAEPPATRIVYAHVGDVPSEAANAVQVSRTCSALVQMGAAVELVVPAQRGFSASGPRAFDQLAGAYALTSRFAVRRLPCPALPGRNLIFGLCAAWRARASGASLVTRSVSVASVSVRLGVPTILELHEFITGWRPGQVRRLGAILKHPSLVKVIFISHRLAQAFAGKWPEIEGRTLVLHSGAETPAPADMVAARPNPVPEDSRLKVGYVGQLYPGKGMEMIEQAAPLCPFAVFHVVGGSGAILAQWRSRLANSPNVILHGYVPYAQTQAYLAGFDVVVAPYQGFVQGQGGGASNLADWMSPLKLFEYMSCGKAIVCSDLPVIREVLADGVNALLVRCDDPAAWSAALKALQEYPDLRRRLAAAARSDFDRAYSLEGRAGRIIEALRASAPGA